MDVYLVQHGEAVSEERDPRRPLTEHGRAEVAKVARQLAELRAELVGSPISEIWHSGKLRAQQTAEVLAPAFRPGATLVLRTGMSPNDDPRPLYGELNGRRREAGGVMLVGHLPYLGRLAGLLLAGDAERTPVRFVYGGVVKIAATESGWSVSWYLTPACVP